MRADLLCLLQFPCALDEVFLGHIVALVPGNGSKATVSYLWVVARRWCNSPNRKHARLGAHVPQIGTVEALRELDDRVVVDLSGLADRSGVDLEDLGARDFVRERDLDLAVDSAGTEQSRVERVGLQEET